MKHNGIFSGPGAIGEVGVQLFVPELQPEYIKAKEEEAHKQAVQAAKNALEAAQREAAQLEAARKLEEKARIAEDDKRKVLLTAALGVAAVVAGVVFAMVSGGKK
jgi:hypothetical protein